MFFHSEFRVYKYLSQIVIIEVVGKLANDVVCYHARSMYERKSKYKQWNTNIGKLHLYYMRTN